VEAVDDGAGWPVGAEFVTAEFATGSEDGAAAGAIAAAEFCAVSCNGRAVDFLLRKRIAAPNSVPAITTIMAAIFQ
jgi:hypothetical protein